MREELQSSIGIYSPSFLKMHIDVYEPLDDIFNLSPKASAAFIHEYVHFLQDLTTVYGQKNIISVVDYIKSVNINQRQSNNRNLNIPYIPQEERDLGVYYNSELQKLHTGTSNKVAIGTILSVGTEIVPTDIGYKTVDVEIVKLILKLNAHSQQTEYSFGAHAIIESMAFGIEKMIYPNEIESPQDFCYEAANALVQFCYPELATDPLNVIALCDASLMYYNPAAIFYNMLMEMKTSKFTPTSPLDVYDFIHSNVEIEFWGLTRINEIYNNHTLTAISCINDYFTSEIFAPNKQWVDDTFKNANNLRISDWGFFVQLASSGSLKKNEIFKHLFKLLGLPMVTNKTGAAYFASPVVNNEAVRPDALWAINQVYNIYINSKKSIIRRCAMEDWCRESCRQAKIEDYTDYRCIESPWERAKDSDKLCVFAQVWKTWGLENEIPIVV